MTVAHPLLQKQLRAVFGDESKWPEEVVRLAAKVEETYREFEQSHALLERSLEISSKELVQSNSEMRVVIQSFPDVFLGLLADGTITSCRASNQDDLLELPRGMVGRRIQDLPGSAARGAFRSALASIAHGSRLESVEYSLSVRGQEQCYEARLMPLRSGHVLAIVRNITERKRVEDEILQSREMALQAARLKSEFLANMSHELRTPMTCIIGMTELTLETELRPEQLEFLRAVKTSADVLLSLLNDILDFSKIEAGKLELEAIPFSLRDCVGGALKSLAIRAHKKDLELACHVPADVPDRLVGDPGRLRQVVLNLAGNAIKFTEQGEIVVEVSSELESEHLITLRVSVRDTGIGIAPEKQGLIFGAFTQADGSMTRKYGGTGLGLAISSQLVELMGGGLSVESAPGRGSTFSFTASFAIETGAAVPAHLAPLETLRDRRILIVDDNETNCSIFASHLGRWHCRVTAVHTGGAALPELVRAHESGEPFELVLLDAQMPEMDGFDVAEQIKKDVRLDLPIIVLTSAGRSGDAARCRALGLSGYLTKPVMSEELQESVQAVFGGIAAGRPRTFVTRHSLREDRRRLRLLLAEDNPVNALMITRTLEKRGHYVRSVESGLDVLATLEGEAFDLILMDVQMPGLDGFETTAAIRTKERGTDRHIPIVALTAHALKGDRERCLAAGMDGYTTKPIIVEELMSTIEVMTAGKSIDIRLDANDPGPSRVLDPSQAIDMFDGDMDLLADAARLQLQEAAHLRESIHAAHTAGDAEALGRTAHRLRSGLAALGARRAAEAALRLETAAENGDGPAIDAAVAEIDHELEELEPALRSLLRAA